MTKLSSDHFDEMLCQNDEMFCQSDETIVMCESYNVLGIRQGLNWSLNIC